MSPDAPASTRRSRLLRRRPSTARRLRLEVSVVDRRRRGGRVPAIGRWLEELAPASARGTVTIVIESDAAVRRLNRTWRGRDQPTDVLSWPAGREDKRPADVPPHLGDIVIAAGVAARQAREAGHSLRQEMRVLALHGFLHLLGYDHDRDQGRMARIERTLRRRGGLEAGLIERAPWPSATGRATP